jgi:hypothetical protein
LGTGPQSVCTNCHTSGDAGYEVADQFQQQIAHFETAVRNSDEILNRAESDGMEVSQPRLEQDQARDALTKARVTVHSFNMVRVQEDILTGLKITDKTYQEGKAALGERDYRRKGLGISVFSIVVVLIGIRLYIRHIEGRQRT